MLLTCINKLINNTHSGKDFLGEIKENYKCSHSFFFWLYNTSESGTRGRGASFDSRDKSDGFITGFLSNFDNPKYSTILLTLLDFLELSFLDVCFFIMKITCLIYLNM
jgi:hypothetical protein